MIILIVWMNYHSCHNHGHNHDGFYVVDDLHKTHILYSVHVCMCTVCVYIYGMMLAYIIYLVYSPLRYSPTHTHTQGLAIASSLGPLVTD